MSTKAIADQKAQSKALLKTKFEEMMKVIKDFSLQKDNLIANLNGLSNTLETEKDPILLESTEKLRSLEKQFQDRRSKQSEELLKLNSKIESLKETQMSLSLLLAKKKAANENLDNQEKETERTVNIF